MIYTSLSAFTSSGEVDIADGFEVAVEGQALVAGIAAGRFGAAPSAGVATEKFIGFSWVHTGMYAFSEPSTVKAEEFIVPTGGVVVLARTPVASTVFAWNKTTGAAIVSAVAGRNVTLTGADAEQVVVSYRFMTTAVEQQYIKGDNHPGGYAGNKLRQVGLAKSGVIYTNHFDTAADWSANVANVRLGANGMLVASGAGPVIDAYVMSLPSVDYPYLGLQFSAAA